MEIEEIIKLFTEEQKKEYYEEYLSRVENLSIEFQEQGKIKQIGNIKIVKFEYSYSEDEEWYVQQFIVLICNNKILKIIYGNSETFYYTHNNELHLICNHTTDVYDINTAEHLHSYYLNKV